MGLVKDDNSSVTPGSVVPTTPSPVPTYRGRDFDAEARGKVASNAYAAAMMSPAIASILGPGSLEDLHKLIDANVAYVTAKVWEAQGGK